MAYEVTAPNGEVWFVEALSDITVVGIDPEMADYSNPRGELYGDRDFLRVSNAQGRVYVTKYYPVHYKVMESAAFRLSVLIETGDVDPHHCPKLHRGTPVYGSKEWAEHGEADEVMWEEKERQIKGF